MNKLLITLVTISVLALSAVLPTSVSAQATSCVPGTGVNGVACVPCYPGPYNICAPNTGIIFTDESINEGAVLFSVAVVLVGIAFILNGKNLKNKA
jgi:hypothetical protein